MFYAFLCILCILIQGTMVEQLCLNGFTLYKYICNKKIPISCEKLATCPVSYGWLRKSKDRIYMGNGSKTYLNQLKSYYRRENKE